MSFAIGPGRGRGPIAPVVPVSEAEGAVGSAINKPVRSVTCPLVSEDLYASESSEDDCTAGVMDPTAPSAFETATTGATGPLPPPGPVAEPTASTPHVKIPNDDIKELSFAPPNSQ
ncbi:hypothetical protein GH714_034989 [Hevea brasiliensis]|uniref:Uncharacterized protein n=1 Tax=Hevea brasiliensis TaxID=3981 RepID=A0A6A6KLY6_HEVBR|nr:hypothetical protein GH714_034989 [Hevea brasiliensis]